MQSTLIVGIILLTGFLFGEIATRFKLPKVTGYILAGILLNPGLFNFMPKDIVGHTSLVTNIALAFITFSVGGTLLYSRIKSLGKTIIYITLFEAEFAFLAIILGFIFVSGFFISIPNPGFFSVIVPLSILLGCLGSPTDPSATLAVSHEYKAKGKVTSTIMGVAASDDALGIINYSLATVLAAAFVLHQAFNVTGSIVSPLLTIFGSIFLGIAFGFIFNIITSLIKKDSEGVLIVFVLGFLSLCFGIATMAGLDELMSTMVMGIVVVNFNKIQKKIFKVLERYIEELIFVLFFTLSGMYLNFSVLQTSLVLILFFVIFRFIGKVSGTYLGAHASKAPLKVKRYASFGLIPQGGIVIGLALIIKSNPAFSSISDIVLSVIIGATVIHELIGPIFAKMALNRAGEIRG